MNREILWLPSWYPNKLTPFIGDFIQRHAQAAALYNKIYVIKVVGDDKGTVTNSYKIEINQGQNLTEEIIYFRKSNSLIGRIIAVFRQRALYKQAIKHFIKENGRPFIVHVHIAMKAGLVALWVKRKYHIPYVVTEQWTGLLEEADEKLADLPLYQQWLYKKIIERSDGITPVSECLANVMKQKFSVRECIVIPNVVNTNIFFQGRTSANPAQKFIHISDLNPRKNPKIIIAAFYKVVQAYASAVLDIYGSENKELLEVVQKMRLENNIKFHPEVPQQILAEAIRSSDALILYSTCETFGCVLIEANACGIPVIVSDLVVFHENVKEGINGIFAGNSDENLLAEKMMFVIKNKTMFNPNMIAELTKKEFGYEVIGKQLNEWYEEIVEKNY
jgi:glycosyltransferase involved in cell wall biosynthesis